MNLAVKFYADEVNPEGIPGLWPSQVIELGKGSVVPPGYTLMTLQEYTDYRNTNRSVYDAWAAGIPPEEESLDQKIQDSQTTADTTLKILTGLISEASLDDQKEALLVLNPVITAMQLGLLKSAAEILNAAPESKLLDAVLDPKDPSSLTLRQALSQDLAKGKL